MESGRSSMQLSMGGMLHSMKASLKDGGRGKDLASSSEGGKSPRASKKLSEKGKAKLARHRAKEKMEEEVHRLEQAYAEAHPELIDENGEMEMPPVDDLFGDGLSYESRLEQWALEERKQIENEEMVRKLAKLQRKHNTMQNAMLKGNKIASGYDRDEIDLRVVQKELKKNREKAKTAVIYLEEPLPLVRECMNAVAVGQKRLLELLEREESLRAFRETDLRYLKASFDAELERRQSPVNFRVEVLWRFACTVQEWKRGDREQNLRMAQHIYQRLLERCDPSSHPFQYASLHNSAELCEIELAKVTGVKILNRANKDFEFQQLEDPSANFNYERKASAK